MSLCPSPIVLVQELFIHATRVKKIRFSQTELFPGEKWIEKYFQDFVLDQMLTINDKWFGLWFPTVEHYPDIKEEWSIWVDSVNEASKKMGVPIRARIEDLDPKLGAFAHVELSVVEDGRTFFSEEV